MLKNFGAGNVRTSFARLPCSYQVAGVRLLFDRCTACAEAKDVLAVGVLSSMGCRIDSEFSECVEASHL